MTHVRATQNDRIFFRIPREHLRPAGLKRLERLEKYNDYKSSLYEEAKKKHFEIPPAGLVVTFYMPLPKSWTKKKRKLYHGYLCQSRPDIDNLIKSFFDSLLQEDKHIASVTATKRWTDSVHGWIECKFIDEPMQVPIEPPVKG